MCSCLPERRKRVNYKSRVMRCASQVHRKPVEINGLHRILWNAFAHLIHIRKVHLPHMLVRLAAHGKIVLGHLRKGIAKCCRLREQLGRCRVAAQGEGGCVAVSEADDGRGSSGGTGRWRGDNLRSTPRPLAYMLRVLRCD